MKKKLFKVLSVVVFAISIIGCQEQAQTSPQREKLQGHLVHQLKLEIDQKDAQIAQLDKKLKECNTELTKSQKQANDCMTSQGNEFMEMITPIMDEMDALRAENQQLKSQLQEDQPSN